MPPIDFQYVGTELTLFSKALVWKRYLRSQIQPFLRGRVAEIGAGLGGTTAVFASSECSEWLAVEPDPSLARQIPSSDRTKVFIGTLADLPADTLADVILYIDVLEHIESDAEELRQAAQHLSSGGHLVVLSPAHNFLFTDFDRHIGHFRRYDKKMLKNAGPSDLVLERMRYLDSISFFASLANRLLLKQSMPNESQILIWDRIMVPISRITDALLLYSFGKSILGVWRKP